MTNETYKVISHDDNNVWSDGRYAGYQQIEDKHWERLHVEVNSDQIELDAC